MMADEFSNPNSPLLNGLENQNGQKYVLSRKSTKPRRTVEKIREPSNILLMGAKKFEDSHNIMRIYSILKLLIALIIFIMITTESFYCNQQDEKMDTQSIWGFRYMMSWMYCSGNKYNIQVLHSVLATYYYSKLLAISGNKVNLLFLAQLLNLTIKIKIPQNYKEQSLENIIKQREKENQKIEEGLDIVNPVKQKKMSILIARKLKEKIFIMNKITNYLGKMLFIMFQCILVFGILFWTCNNKLYFSECYYSINVYVSFATIFGIYEYIEYYCKVIGQILIFPIYLCCKLKNYIQQFKQKRRQLQRIPDNFKEWTYNGKQNLEEQECSICLQEYQINERITTLSCSEKHYFHSKCAIAWLHVNQKCPICRVQVLQNE